MFNPFEALFTSYVNGIIKEYKSFKPLFLTAAIGFNGSTASQQLTVFTPAVDADTLIFGFNVDFSNANMVVKITDVSSGYVWNQLQSTTTQTILGTPNQAIFGVSANVMPVLALTCPFFMSRQSKLQFDCTNSASSLTTGGNITAVCLKLLN